MDSSVFLFFDSVKEASNDMNTFWTWDLSRKRNQLFFEKILYANDIKVNKVSLNVPETSQKIVLSIIWDVPKMF